LTTVLVASSGGHLKELHHLHRRVAQIAGPYRWVTFDTPQSRSLLAGEEVEFVRFVGDRDAVNAVRSLGAARRIVSDPGVAAVVSTGASVALPFLVMARAHRRRCLYVESAARINGPSLTGRLLSGMPGIALYTQHPSWAGGRWHYGGSVFDAFESAELCDDLGLSLERIVVTLGTTREAFRRLVHRLLEILPPQADVLWQTGNTDSRDLGISGHYALPERELTQAMADADVVVSHAGVGTALAALEVGKCPVVVPRRARRGELVDDHQVQIAQELGDRGLSVSVEVEDLTYADLVAASRRRVTMVPQAPPLASPAAKAVH
jgi:UDP-N-acetylglucosamine--N-acetylmuramyl-(pentapeptide) pyrophosphoryl-undecaprenol N-acetylglucosamine transferase